MAREFRILRQTVLVGKLRFAVNERERILGELRADRHSVPADPRRREHFFAICDAVELGELHAHGVVFPLLAHDDDHLSAFARNGGFDRRGARLKSFRDVRERAAM